MPTVENAIALAVRAHRGQVQKDGSPYILHALAVMMQMHTPNEQMAAVLHDVIEDTAVSLDDLRVVGYPDAVIDALDALTHRSDETYEAYIERVKADPLARRVKLADLAHNMDVRRLTEVTGCDAQRLERYRRVWAELRAIEDADLPG